MSCQKKGGGAENVILLGVGKELTVVQSNDKGRVVLISNLGDTLEINQLNTKGIPQLSISLKDEENSSISYFKGDEEFHYDEDGDGMVDMKIVGNKIYKIASYECVEVNAK